jgi:hypothetical protein
VGQWFYAEQPTLLTVSDVLWAKCRRQLGLKAEATPVLVVISDQKRASAGAAGGLPFESKK